MSVIEAYVTNLGRYVGGDLVGEYLKLPASTEDVQSLLKRIGVDGKRYEEIIITDFDTQIDGLHDHLTEYADIDELNYLASLLDEMDEGDLEKFEAALFYGEYTGSLKDLINLAQNLDCYEYYPGISDDDDLGRYLIDELSALEVPEYLENYIDYEAYGRDASLDDGGRFTDGGYIVSTQGSFIEHYNGKDIPEEYRIFAYPKEEERPSILETIKRFQEAKNEAPTLPGERRRPAAEHDER